MSGSGVAQIAAAGSVPSSATVLEIMLEVARTMGLPFEGISTGGSTTSLIDTGLEAIADHYLGGTLWILSGDNVSECVKVKTHDGNTVTFSTMAHAIAADVTYALTSADYPKYLIKQAVLDVLRFDECLLKNDTLVVIDDTEEYTLPDNVSNVYGVQVAKNSAEPYSYVDNYYWKEYDGKLIFDLGRYPTVEDRKIRLWYLGYHGVIAESASVEATVPMKWLIWKSVENLYRKKYVYLSKNSPEQIELLNEAKENVKYAELTASKYELRSGNPQPKLANY